jgi:alkanesulfonate monooxygenase SsuD/methylene tetrahydromethanopterin reductase-like flavin-dependent oxidoreductase (luciferase family)
MIEIALMIEGQDGLNWERWRQIARVAEDSGYVGLYRSDHFTNPRGPYKDSLECWTSLTWLAGHTSRLEFGPLVSPLSFHHPSNLVRVAAAIDDLSGGRLQFSVAERMLRLREGVQIMAHLLHDDQPLTFHGRCYTLEDAVLLPRPTRHVPIVIGGSGRQVTLPLVARYADEWNLGFRTPEQFGELNAYLDSLLDRAGRPRSAVRRTLMTRLEYDDLDRLRQQVAAFEAAGVQRLMLQWLELDKLDGMARVARALMG